MRQNGQIAHGTDQDRCAPQNGHRTDRTDRTDMPQNGQIAHGTDQERCAPQNGPGTDRMDRIRNGPGTELTKEQTRISSQRRSSKWIGGVTYPSQLEVGEQDVSNVLLQVLVIVVIHRRIAVIREQKAPSGATSVTVMDSVLTLPSF